MIDLVKVSDEVFQAVGQVTYVTNALIDELEKAGSLGRSGRARILLHQGQHDVVHEMIIRHPENNLDRPHRGKLHEKSFTAIRGDFALVLFSEDGVLEAATLMGPSGPNHAQTARISSAHWHTVVPLGGPIIFLEVAVGPFRGNEFPTWSPSPGDDSWGAFAEMIRAYVLEQTR